MLDASFTNSGAVSAVAGSGPIFNSYSTLCNGDYYHYMGNANLLCNAKLLKHEI